MRKRIYSLLGVTALITLVILGCSKNKFKLTQSQPTDIPYYNLSNDTCYVCHNTSSLKKSIGTETVPLYVDREKFARSIHRANRCVDCHANIVWDNVKKEHPIVPKYYGGWANFSSEDIIQGRNYYTFASISCFNNICHPDQEGFNSSQHYSIQDVRNSRAEFKSGIFIGRDYEVSCNKCHLTCATCHFKGDIVKEGVGEITDYWGQLLTGAQVPGSDELTNWAIDWTSNVESHDFATGEELEDSDDLCRICHTGFYSNYNQKGYYHLDGSADWDSLISQRVEKYPQHEEWRFLKGDIMVNTGIPYLDSLYVQVENQQHFEYRCIDCHSKIHSLEPINCEGCHSDKINIRPKHHQDISCIACHDATMSVWRDPDSGDTIRVAGVKDNKVINWHSHMIIKQDGINTDFCNQKCHNPETGGRIGANFSHPYSGTVHR